MFKVKKTRITLTLNMFTCFTPSSSASSVYFKHEFVYWDFQKDCWSETFGCPGNCFPVVNQNLLPNFNQ